MKPKLFFNVSAAIILVTTFVLSLVTSGQIVEMSSRVYSQALAWNTPLSRILQMCMWQLLKSILFSFWSITP